MIGETCGTRLHLERRCLKAIPARALRQRIHTPDERHDPTAYNSNLTSTPMLTIVSVLLAFVATIIASCHLDAYLTSHYLQPGTKKFFSSYTMWSHAYCGMVLMTWLVAINNVRSLVVRRKQFKFSLELGFGLLIAVGVGVSLFLRTRGVKVPIPGAVKAEDAVLCVPIGDYLQLVLFAPAALVALATSAAMKFQALRATLSGEAADLLDPLLNSIMLEIGLFIFVVLEIALIWFVQVQCDGEYLPPAGTPSGVAAHFATSAGIGMFLIVAIPSAAILIVIKSLPAADPRVPRWTRKAWGALAGSLAPAVAGALIQAWAG